MWLTGLVAPRHVGSSQTRARTRVPCTGRQTLNHCATREAPTRYILTWLQPHNNSKKQTLLSTPRIFIDEKTEARGSQGAHLRHSVSDWRGRGQNPASDSSLSSSETVFLHSASSPPSPSWLLYSYYNEFQKQL